jgi:hypothetical protein
MTTFQAKDFTPRRGQVVALLAHTTCLKIESIVFDCSIVSRIETRGTHMLAQPPSCVVVRARSKLGCDNKACDAKATD